MASYGNPLLDPPRYVFDSMEPLRKRAIGCHNESTKNAAHGEHRGQVGQVGFEDLPDFLSVLGPMWRKELKVLASAFPRDLAQEAMAALAERVLNDAVCGVQPLLERLMGEHDIGSRE